MKPYILLIHAEGPRFRNSAMFKADDDEAARKAGLAWIGRNLEHLQAANAVSCHRLNLGEYDWAAGIFATRVGPALFNEALIPQLYRSERDRVVDDGRPPFAPSEASAG